MVVGGQCVLLCGVLRGVIVALLRDCVGVRLLKVWPGLLVGGSSLVAVPAG